MTPRQAALYALQNQKAITPWPYYSTVRFNAPGTGDDPITYTLSTTARRAFSYAVGQSKQPAGFQAIEEATIADTNLVNPNQTTSGQAVLIQGIKVQAKAGALYRPDATSAYRLRKQSGALLAALWECCSVELSLNGDNNRYRLGALSNIPGGSALTGAAPDASGLPAFSGGPAPVDFAANGWQTAGNYFRLPENLIWMPQGSEDSNLNVIFTPSRAITLTSGGPDNPIANVEAGTGVQAYNFPSELIVDLKVQLVGQTVAPRTRAS